MRFSTFLPAVLALTLFTATQAATQVATDHTKAAVDVLKRGDNDVISAVANVFINAHIDAAVDIRARVTAQLRADINVDLNAKVDVLGGVVTADVDVAKLKVQVRAKVDADIKARVDAEIKAKLNANIRASVEAAVLSLCSKNDLVCIKTNAEAIVAKVNVDIVVRIEKLLIQIKANVHAYIRANIDIIVKQLAINLGLVNATITAAVSIHAAVDVHIVALVRVWARIWANVKVVALIRAL